MKHCSFYINVKEYMRTDDQLHIDDTNEYIIQFIQSNSPEIKNVFLE